MRFTRSTRTVRVAAVTAAALGLVATSALSASADTPGVPDQDDIVVVGSDTTQKVWNDLANVYNGRTPAPARQLKTFDAVPAGSITIRNDNPATGGTDPVSITRPNGSGAGIAELVNPTSAAGAVPVDVARSSRGRSTDPDTVGFVRFAQDNLRPMVNDDVTGVTELTDAELTSIYHCDTTNWNQLGGPDLAIVPLIPQTQSGTRAAWLQRVGVTDVTQEPCVTDQNNTVQEHDPAPVAATAGSIAPVSLGRYNQLSGDEKAGTFLATIPSPDDTEYNRDLFQVVRLDELGDVADLGVAAIVGDGSLGGGGAYLCEPADSNPATTTGGDVIRDNGFTPLGGTDDCGTFE